MECFHDSNVSVERAYEDFFNQKYIQEQCSGDAILRLREAFLTAHNEEMDVYQLHDAFQNILEIYMSKEKFNVLFKKINLKQNGYATWSEFLSYLELEYQEKYATVKQQLMELPVRGAPVMIKSRHRTPICRILFYPEISQNGSTSFAKGTYLTVSKDGVINYWSLDLNYERTTQSKNPNLKVQPTVITDMIVMPDVQILGTSSTECDLRFYDIAARKFDLRLWISGLDKAVVCMSYYFNSKVQEDDSIIVLGDMGGSVTIMTFNPLSRGPFKQMLERDLINLRYQDVLKGAIKGIKITEIKSVHSDWVNQVGYYASLKSFVSSSRCSNCSLLISDITGTIMQYKFKVSMGISCFTLREENQMLVTGGADCVIRIWNAFVPRRATTIFHGHHATICAIVIQDTGRHIYSLSKDRCVKVWDIVTQSCIQTYYGLPSDLGDSIELCIVYNTLTHKMIIAGAMIATIICDPVINAEVSDGFTHIKPVTCILYNHLYKQANSTKIIYMHGLQMDLHHFQNKRSIYWTFLSTEQSMIIVNDLHKKIVTTGADSCIIVWDPWSGRRLKLKTNAHSKIEYGQYISIEITAACFDDAEQLLVTGARNGSIKIWIFNTGTCIRNMEIGDQREVTSIIWVENRIICSGWNRQVVEFSVTETDIHRKSWGMKHTDYILCSAVRYPQVLATATYNGELILWRLETGQPFRMYKVNDPIARYVISFGTENKEKTAQFSERKNSINDQLIDDASILPTVCPHQKSALNFIRTISVQAIIFLTNRKSGPSTGTLLVSLESGLIQVWSHHPAGGFLTAFSAIHSTGDCVLAMATDPHNCFLITGHRTGYLKVWYLGNYLLPEPPEMNKARLFLEFPFLWKDRINGRAKRAVRDQPLPILLSSVRGHLSSVTALQLISDVRIIVSGSSDKTVRLWTLGCRYLSTLGTFKPWAPILSTVPVQNYFENFRFPPDIMRSASFTTVKVLNDGKTRDQDHPEGVKVASPKMISEQLGYKEETISEMYSKPIKFDLPVLDNSLPYIPIYAHLKTYPIGDVTLSKLPVVLQPWNIDKQTQQNEVSRTPRAKKNWLGRSKK